MSDKYEDNECDCSPVLYVDYLCFNYWGNNGIQNYLSESVFACHSDKSINALN